MNDFQDRVVIVTGAGGGIGSATARMFAGRGAKLVCAEIVESVGQRTADVIVAEGGEAIAVGADLADEAQIAGLIDAAMARYGRIDVLHNNAADQAPEMSPQFDTDVERTPGYVWQRALMVNVRGTALACQYALPHMVAGGGGSIVNTVSNLGLQGNLVQVAYSASKAALIQLTRSVAASHGRRGIRCNAVAPGLTLTQSVRDNVPQPHIDAVLAETLLPYLGEPDDIAHAAVFLASDAARSITGHVLVVDGGTASHVPGFEGLSRANAH